MIRLRIILLVLGIILLNDARVIAQATKNRMVILADMGNEPDEEQQMVHLLIYANEFDIEGLIAVTGKFLNPQSKIPYRQYLHPELLNNIIDNYDKVLPNLKIHATGWPEASYLRSIVANGQPNYGMAGTGEGKSTEGSELLKRCITKDDSRPLYIVVNAGSNTLAQALIDIERQCTPEQIKKIISKLRVFENGAQDDAGAWICGRYRDIHWIRSNYQTYCFGGPGWDSKKGWEEADTNLGPHTWKPYEYSAIGQHQWALKHIKGGHGLLGVTWPIRQTMSGRIGFMEGGGTIPWMGLINQGLSSIDQPSWGGWGGRYSKEKIKNVWSKHSSVKTDEQKYGDFYVFADASDTWIDPETDSLYNDIYTPVWRWRKAMFNDFQCRMDWCFAPLKEANHPPIAAINGAFEEEIKTITVKAGQVLRLDASGSYDPDGNTLSFNWWIYQEVGNYPSVLAVTNPHASKTSFNIPSDSSGKEIHIILEVKDDHKIASMFDYRRIVLNVR